DEKFERYVRTDWQGSISVRRVADDAELYHFPSGIGECSLQLSPSGRFLLVSRAPQCKVWELGDREARGILDQETFATGGFRPDSRAFAIVHTDGSISLYDRASGQLVQRLSAGPVPHSAAFSPNGRKLALPGKELTQVRDLETGQVISELHPPTGAKDV